MSKTGTSGEPHRSGKRRGAQEGPVGDPVEFHFFNEVGIIEQLARNAFERIMPGGMTLAQFSVLNHFVRLGGAWNLVRLAGAFQVSKAAMTQLVAKLRAKGLVAVSPDPEDGRGKLVSITPEGRKARDDAVDRLTPLLTGFRKDIPPEELQRAIPVLEAVRTWLDEHR